jgi:hypothetical protein
MVSQIRRVDPAQCHNPDARSGRTSVAAIGWPMACIIFDGVDGRFRRGSRWCAIIAAISAAHDCGAWSEHRMEGDEQAGAFYRRNDDERPSVLLARRGSPNGVKTVAPAGAPTVSKIRANCRRRAPILRAPSSICTVSIKTIWSRSKGRSARPPPKRSLGWLCPVSQKGARSSQSARSWNLGARAVAMPSVRGVHRRHVSFAPAREHAMPAQQVAAMFAGSTFAPGADRCHSQGIKIRDIARDDTKAMPLRGRGDEGIHRPRRMAVFRDRPRAADTGLFGNFAELCCRPGDHVCTLIAAALRVENHDGHNRHFRRHSPTAAVHRRRLPLMRLVGSHSGQSRRRRESFKENHRASEVLLHPARVTGAPGKKAVAREGRLIRGPS